MTGRWFPYAELEFIFADKIQVDVRQFGKTAQNACKPVAVHYLDTMIAKGGFENQKQKFGGTMHQFAADGFRTALSDLIEANPILKAAAAGGDTFWSTTFAELSA